MTVKYYATFNDTVGSSEYGDPVNIYRIDFDPSTALSQRWDPESCKWVEDLEIIWRVGGFDGGYGIEEVGEELALGMLVKGGRGSGNHGHAGRIGKRGGSLKRGESNAGEKPEYKKGLAEERNKIYGKYLLSRADGNDFQIEWAVAINEDGEQVILKRGGENIVTFTDEEIESLRGKTLLHNHPSNSSLSNEDILFTVVRKLSAAEVVTRGSSGGIAYRIEPGPSGKWFERGATKEDVADLQLSLKFANREIYEKYYKMVNSLELTPEEAQIRHTRDVARKIAGIYGWIYSEVEF